MGQPRRSTLGRPRQVTGPERDRIAAQLREAYRRGASIRELMTVTGRSYGLVRTVSTAARAAMNLPPTTLS